MNKILISKKEIICDSKDVIIDKRTITFNNPGEYILEYLDNGEYKYNFVINDRVKLIELSFDKELDIKNKYIINDGCLEVFKFYNNLSVNEVIDIDLCQPKCLVNYYFTNICRMEEKYLININHKCEYTYSKIINRSVALKNSVLDFVINSNVKEKAIKAILDQNTRIVTMGECDAKISPNMFIPIDDVEARHGSVIGAFKDDQVFYLMSKGISYNDTINLLVRGYILGNLFVDYETRRRVIDIIDTYWR